MARPLRKRRPVPMSAQKNPKGSRGCSRRFQAGHSTLCCTGRGGGSSTIFAHPMCRHISISLLATIAVSPSVTPCPHCNQGGGSRAGRDADGRRGDHFSRGADRPPRGVRVGGAVVLPLCRRRAAFLPPHSLSLSDGGRYPPRDEASLAPRVLEIIVGSPRAP